MRDLVEQPPPCRYLSGSGAGIVLLIPGLGAVCLPPTLKLFATRRKFRWAGPTTPAVDRVFGLPRMDSVSFRFSDDVCKPWPGRCQRPKMSALYLRQKMTALKRAWLTHMRFRGHP